MKKMENRNFAWDIANAIKDIVFHGQAEIDMGAGNDFTVNYNEDGDHYYVCHCYTNGRPHKILLCAKCEDTSAYYACDLQSWDEDYYAVIDFLNSEQAEAVLTERFEENFRQQRTKQIKRCSA